MTDGERQLKEDLAGMRVARDGTVTLRGQVLGRVERREWRDKMAKRAQFGYYGNPHRHAWSVHDADGKLILGTMTSGTRRAALRLLRSHHKRAGTLPPPGGDWDDAGDRARMLAGLEGRMGPYEGEAASAARRRRAQRIRFEGKLVFGSRRGTDAAKIKEAIMAGRADGGIAIDLDVPTKNVTWYRWWLGKHGHNPPAGR